MWFYYEGRSINMANVLYVIWHYGDALGFTPLVASTELNGAKIQFVDDVELTMLPEEARALQQWIRDRAAQLAQKGT